MKRSFVIIQSMCLTMDLLQPLLVSLTRLSIGPAVIPPGRLSYRSILGREPSEDGLGGHAPMVPVGGGSMRDMVDSFVNSPEYNERFMAALVPARSPSYIEDQLLAIRYRLALLEEGRLRLQIEDLQRQVTTLEQRVHDGEGRLRLQVEDLQRQATTLEQRLHDSEERSDCR